MRGCGHGRGRGGAVFGGQLPHPFHVFGAVVAKEGTSWVREQA